MYCQTTIKSTTSVNTGHGVTPTFRDNLRSVASHDNRALVSHLLQLIYKHRHLNGWIVLVSPCRTVIKQLKEQKAVSMEKVLVVHNKKNTAIESVLLKAFTSLSCAVVINFNKIEDKEKLAQLYNHALNNNTWFYQQDDHLTQQVSH